jgi:hypothetical protein
MAVTRRMLHQTLPSGPCAPPVVTTPSVGFNFTRRAGKTAGWRGSRGRDDDSRQPAANVRRD